MSEKRDLTKDLARLQKYLNPNYPVSCFEFALFVEDSMSEAIRRAMEAEAERDELREKLEATKTEVVEITSRLLTLLGRIHVDQRRR